jgi:hypothetical protein
VYDFRYLPYLFGHVQFLVLSNHSKPKGFFLPDYVCYDEKVCLGFLPATIRFNNLTCRHFNDLGLNNIDSFDNLEKILISVKNRFRACLMITKEVHCSNDSTMYQCKNSSKCISKQRLVDGIQDCPYDDGETFNQSCLLKDIRQRLKCSDHYNEKCFSTLISGNGRKICSQREDEMSQEQHWVKNNIFFQNIWDGRTDLFPVLIDGRNETDETECPYWPCNNTYSRCDGFWLCKNGADEVNCPPSLCPKHHHDCVLLNDTSKVSFLPITQFADGIVDCLGSTDERIKDYMNFDSYSIQYQFQCLINTETISSNQLCDRTTDCPLNDDEIFCSRFGSAQRPFCTYEWSRFTDVDRFLYSFSRISFKYFKLSNIPTYSLYY